MIYSKAVELEASLLRIVASVDIVCDTPDSFMWDWIPMLKMSLEMRGHLVRVCRDFDEINRETRQRDIGFFVSCRTIIKKEILDWYKLPLVAQPSKLPNYRGSGVLAWQILDGSDELWVKMFRPTEVIDNGPIVLQRGVSLKGTELLDELRQIQAILTWQMCEDVLRHYLGGNLSFTEQPAPGEDDKVLPRRTPQNSEIDFFAPLHSQFNLLRVVDNTRYSAFFQYEMVSLPISPVIRRRQPKKIRRAFCELFGEP